MMNDGVFLPSYLKQIAATVDSYDPQRNETSFTACSDVFNDLKPHLKAITESAEFIDGDFDEANDILEGIDAASLYCVTFSRNGEKTEEAVIRFDLSLPDERDVRIELDLDMDDENPGNFKLAWYGWVRLYGVTGKHEFEIIEHSALSEALDVAGSEDIYISPDKPIVLLPPETMDNNPLIRAAVDALKASPDAMAIAMVQEKHFVDIRESLRTPEWQAHLTEDGVAYVLRETFNSPDIASRADIRALWVDLSKGYPDVFQDTLQWYAENKIIEPDAFWMTDETTTKGRPVLFLLDSLPADKASAFSQRIMNMEISEQLKAEISAWQLKREIAPTNKRSMKL